jgi:diaminohydroxyphosphoribosylaminopyrimidine deaminase/5-amino-6-(5-phosphoribosylamino)uracil reductase
MLASSDLAPGPPGPFMARALTLAREVKGRTSPNPAVGAVVVRDGQIVGEGATQPYGGPHAEPIALRAAGDRARGAALYVTLEPCSHTGRTPPCVDAVIAAGITEVHLATLDPNPRVAGRGALRLQEAGVATYAGEAEEEARDVNEDFARWITTGLPLLIAKYAVSLDGRIATRTGESRWITGPNARAEVHRLRDRVDAILVGANTVVMDDPELTTRIEQPIRPPRDPWRIVVDSSCRISPDARVFRVRGSTTVFTTESAPEVRRAALEEAGAEVRVVGSREGRVALDEMLADVGRRQATSIVAEGGPTLLGALFDAGLVDEVLAFIAPLVIGGEAAPSAVGGYGVKSLVDAPRLSRVRVRHLGADTLISGYVRRVRWPNHLAAG